MVPFPIGAIDTPPGSIKSIVREGASRAYAKSNSEKGKGTQDDQAVEGRMGEEPRAPHVSPEILDIPAPNQQDYKYDPSAPVADPNGPKCDPPPNEDLDNVYDPKILPPLLLPKILQMM